MCVTLCSRRKILFWNHQDCTLDFCPIVREQHGSCQTCRHQRDDMTCALTNTPLPEAGGCCHWNVTPVEDSVRVTPVMVAPLAGFFDRASNVLADIPHQVSDDTWVIPAAYIETLAALGIDYQISEAGLVVHPDQLLLVIDEPVTDILDRLDVPYHLDPKTEEVIIDPGLLQLPLTYGQGVEG